MSSGMDADLARFHCCRPCSFSPGFSLSPASLCPQSKELDTKMAKEHAADEEVNKLLLLGAGESGKSTLFKQMIQVRLLPCCAASDACCGLQIYGKGFPEAERKSFINVIHNNIITAMKTLVQQSNTYGPIGQDAAESRKFVDTELKGDEEIDERVGQHLAVLWADKGIQATYEQRSRYQLTDSAAYFFDKITEVRFIFIAVCCTPRIAVLIRSFPARVVQIAKKSYIPNEQDILRCRVRTTGILENDFVIDGNQFKMVMRCLRPICC